MQFTVYTTRHTCGARARRTREGEGADGGKDNYLRCWSISQTEGRREAAVGRNPRTRPDRPTCGERFSIYAEASSVQCKGEEKDTREWEKRTHQPLRS